VRRPPSSCVVHRPPSFIACPSVSICGRPSFIARRSAVVVRYPPWLMVVARRSSPVHRPSSLVIHPSSIVVGRRRWSRIVRRHRASCVVVGAISSAQPPERKVVSSMLTVLDDWFTRDA